MGEGGGSLRRLELPRRWVSVRLALELTHARIEARHMARRVAEQLKAALRLAWRGVGDGG